MSLKCFYHPEREASSKCEQCEKLICLECKMVYHQVVHGGSSNAYTKRYEYCPICYYDTQIKKSKINLIGGVIALSVLIISFFIFTFTLPEIAFSYPATYIPIGFLLALIIIGSLIFGYLQLVRKPKKVNQFNLKKEEFLKSVQAPLFKKETKSTFCSECGNKIDSKASFCSYCGTTLNNRT
ncbi:MAG: zinc-ribbon domain-containing protein [Candidatus Hodarchaeota archaeon]